MIIKMLLLVSLGAAALLAVRNRFPVAGLALRRILGVLVLGVGATAIVMPELVTWIAHRVGVGRGTDLVLYVLAVVSLFVWIAEYQRIRNLEDQIAALSRSLAISEWRSAAREPGRQDEPCSKPIPPHVAVPEPRP